jgi:hypothetical protein
MSVSCNLRTFCHVADVEPLQEPPDSIVQIAQQ